MSRAASTNEPLIAAPAVLPLTVEEKGSRLGRLVHLALVAAAGALIASPILLVTGHAVADPTTTLEAIASRPLAAVQIVLATLVLGALFLLPMLRRAGRALVGRSVKVDGGIVHVTERRLAGTRTWSEPVAAYAGLAHVVRSSLSGTRHELVLAHRDGTRTVTIRIAERISEAEVAATVHLLGTREIAARDLVRVDDLLAVWPESRRRANLSTA